MRTALAFALLVLVGTAASVSAQAVRYARPFRGTRSVSAYFDHNPGGGCTDWACGGVCYDTHTGTDYPMPVGSELLGAAPGRVVATFNGCSDYGYRGNPCGGRCGNHVVIGHDDGSRSTYCHMQRGSIRVGVGDRVACGQVLGGSASSGSSTGPHLHFGHRSPGAGSASDPYAGACSRATSLWVSQGAYRASPSAECSDACRPSAEVCNGLDDDCDGAIDEDLVRTCGTDVGECVAGTETCSRGSWDACVGATGPTLDVCDGLDNDCNGVNDDERICEREEVAWSAALHAPAADTDVDGDGRADACAQTATGFACLTASERGFTRRVGGAALGDADFWVASSVRIGDLDGDGRADVCARDGERFDCWRSNGVAFSESIPGPNVATATELELADVDGDGLLDLCARDAEGLRCHHGTGHGFGAVSRLLALSDADGFADVIHHGSLRFGDVDGDGRVDVCARDAAGVDCWRSEGDHFGARLRGPRWSDDAGFAALGYWSTLRLADIDGDARADLCARTPEGFRCALSTASGFGAEIVGPPMNGPDYERADVYTTLRLADLDGDGRADLCVREPEGVRCWLFDGRGFGRLILGPALSDEAGWTAPARFRSLRLADIDGDGRADLCARHADGLRCSSSTGDGFGRTWIAPAWNDESGLRSSQYATTIRIAGGRPPAPQNLMLRGVFGCSASGGRPTAPLVSFGVLALALVLRCVRRKSAQ